MGIFEDPEYDSQVKDKEGSEKSAEVVELMGLVSVLSSFSLQLRFCIASFFFILFC